jgi:hypothetical protein
MEPRRPPFVPEPDPEEPMEVADYYEALRIGLISADEDLGSDLPPFEPNEE